MNNNQQEAHEWHSPQLRVAKRGARAGVGCNAAGIVTSKCGEKTGTHCHQDVLEAVFVDRSLLFSRTFALLDGVLASSALLCNHVLLCGCALYLCVLLRHLHHTYKRESVREDEECHHRKAHGNQRKRETRSFLVILVTMAKYS